MHRKCGQLNDFAWDYLPHLQVEEEAMAEDAAEVADEDEVEEEAEEAIIIIPILITTHINKIAPYPKKNGVDGPKTTSVIIADCQIILVVLVRMNLTQTH